MEVWKDIRDYEGIYQVSNLGRVRNVITNKILKACETSKGGYMKLMLWKEHKPKNKLVHRLVAEAFLENPLNKRNINHKDCNKQNNKLDNLEWCTQSENIQHAHDNGLMKNAKNNMIAAHTKLTFEEVLDIRNKFNNKINTAKELAEMYGISHFYVYNLVHNVKRKFN